MKTIFVTKNKSKLRGDARYHPHQNLLSSRLLCKNLQITLYKIAVLSVVLCGYETWSLTLREKQRLRVSEKRAL